MATAYSSEVSVGSYNRIRIKCDYSGTSATCTIQFRRTSSYNTTWADPSAKLTFNGTTKAANYSYSGTVGTSWVNLRSAISGYSVSITGGTYNWNFTNPGGGVLACSGKITIPSQATAPTAPTISASATSDTAISATYGTTNVGNPAATVTLYGDTASSPTTSLDSKTTTGNTTYSHTSLTANTTYYYKASASNSAGTNSSSVVSATTYPAGLTSLSVASRTDSSITLSAAFASSGSALTTTAQYRLNQSGNWIDTTFTDVQGTTKSITISSLTPNTSYTIEVRVNTTAGSSTASSVNVKTDTDRKLYGSVSGNTKRVNKLYGSLNGQTKKIKKLYGSVNGVTKLIYEEV